MGGPYGDRLLDLLWSDPTESDEVEGVQANAEVRRPAAPTLPAPRRPAGPGSTGRPASATPTTAPPRPPRVDRSLLPVARQRGGPVVCYGPDRVEQFLAANELKLIVRAHECVMDGFERFAAGKLITVFSATNYCGTANNAGAILVVGRDLVVVPKLIHPLPPSALTDGDGSPQRLGGDPRAGSSAPAWLEQINRERPATPPRGRPPARNAGSLAWI